MPVTELRSLGRDRGPVSAVIAQEILGELRRQGIVVWLDKDSNYTRLVDDLAAKQVAGEFPFPVVGFRGSFLDLLFKLEPFGSGLEKQPLLIHMPGFTEQSIRATPILELYEPGVRFRKGLDTLIREAATARVAPAEVEKFVAKQSSLEEADAWLSSAVSQSTFGLAAALDEFGPRMLAEALAQPSSLAPRVTAPEEVATLRNYIHRLTGLDEGWEAFYPDTESKPLERTLHQLGAWILAVEYVHDLRRSAHDERLRRLKNLSAPLVKACCDLAGQIRRDNGDAYARIADEVEGFLVDELAAMSPDDLGHVDTFREEENRVLTGAVDALRKGEWAKAKAWCEVRQGDKSFWLQRDQLRRWAWNLVAEAAEFGETLARHRKPFQGARSLDEAAERYANGGYEVDRAHRRFEQRRLALLESRLPHYGALREVATELRKVHRAWADQLTREFSTLCREHGFLPAPELRQRNLFEQVVHPLTLTSEKVAVFLIDAFRFEMATELVEELKGAGTVVDLKPRLAELPTITSVGMNVLAPVSQGDKLTVAGIFQGFKTGEFTVRKPEDRSRAMGMRSAGKPALLLKLAAVCEASTAALTKDVKPHQVIVVHSKEIDDAGEANVGLPTFESTLRQIKAAWHHLQLAGVKNFVFTADHGFLLQDETTEIRPFGTKRDPQRRHVLDEHPRAESGMVNVSVSSLGYEGLSGYLLFRDDTAVFATGNPGATFVHGGNSPQERVIPVLTVARKRVEQSGYSAYDVEVEPLPDVVGLHRLRIRIVFAKQTTTSLGFAGARVVDLSLRVLERDSVRVIFKDVAGPGALKTGRLQLPVNEAWTEVFFGLEGPADDRVRVEVYHPDSIERVRSATPEAWYSVSGTAVGVVTKGAKPSSSPPPAPEGWAGTIADESIRRVFLHIEKHGSVTEPEVTNLLGSPRAFRRFSLEFETHLPKLPFKVRIETADGGKRYVREGDR
jgi:hypothetical protein